MFAKKLGDSSEAEFSRKHRVRRPPRRIDDNPNTIPKYPSRAVHLSILSERIHEGVEYASYLI